MKTFTKITLGFVTQCYKKDKDGKYHCTGQEFIAGDQVDFEDGCGNAVTPPDHEYQPFNMTLISKDEIINRLEALLESIDVGSEQSRQFTHEITAIRDLIDDLGRSTVDQKSDIRPHQTDLLEACKVLVSYTMDLLQRLDNQVNLDDVGELRQARDAVDRYEEMSDDFIICEQCSQFPAKKIPVKITSENGQLWIQPKGYGEKCTQDGQGSPVGLEIWKSRLRVIIFDDINKEDPKITDLENARESSRK